MFMHGTLQLQMAIVKIMGIRNFDDDVEFWYTITVLMPVNNVNDLVIRNIISIFWHGCQ